MRECNEIGVVSFRRWLIAVVLITAPVTGALCTTKAMQEYKALAATL